MKKLIILITLCFIGFEMYAQVQKGDSNFGTNFGLIDQKGDDPVMNYSYTYFSLGYQYYLSNNVSIGIAPAVTSTKVLDKSIIVNSRAINLFIDYSFLSTRGKVMPYFGFKYTSMLTTMKWEDPTAAIGFLTDITGGVTGTGSGGIPIPGGGFGSLLDGGIDFEYKRTIMSLDAGIKFFITERLNMDNNLTVGKVTKEAVSVNLLGTSIDVSSDDGGTFIQYTLGFGYIIGRKGT